MGQILETGRPQLLSTFRVGDEDPRCGPASLQIFSGEDLQALAHLQQRKEEDRQSWEAQARAKANEAALQAAARKVEQLKVF